MIQLHVHSHYSLLDSTIKIEDLVKKAKSCGHNAIALTDHGTIAGFVDLYTECKKAGIKPIFGCEFYHVPVSECKTNYHLILWAKNKIGFNNLIELNNRAYNNFYKRPRITDKDLEECGKGLIGATACIGGYLPQTIIDGNPDFEWYEKIKVFLDDFYLELQDNEIEKQYLINKALMSYCKEKCIITNDMHYLEKDHEFAHRVLLAIRSKKNIYDANVMRFDGSGYYFRTEFNALIPDCAFSNTEKIAEQVEQFDIGYKDWQLPIIKVDESEEYFDLNDKLFIYVNQNNKDLNIYQKRFDYEFEVIKKNNFLPYFKIISDLCTNFDKKNRFRGWGRGSVSGSLVSFLYGITKIDPLEWNLYFERFLNPDRISPPDIDMDFMPEDRHEAIDYLKKYGNVIQIGTYTTFGSKEVINSVSKAMGVRTDLIRFVPNEAPVPTIAELVETPSFKKQVMREQSQDFVNVCLIIEGLKRADSIHAAGIVITNDKLPVRIAQTGVNSGVPATSWDMYALEDLKYIKYDILGVKNLKIIDNILKQIGMTAGSIPLNDKTTFEFIQSCNTTGVFQWESEGYRQLIKRLKPDKFDELLDLNTLYRPGCLESGLTDEYIDRKFGKSPVKQLLPSLNLGCYGLPLYQEDIMRIAVDVAGFTLSEADTLRKAIGKKIKEMFEEIKGKFVTGCIKHSNLSEDNANKLWDMVEKFARYTWNKAHAVAYTLISWWTAYLSANYPVLFMCELLNNADDADRRRILLTECRKRGIELEYPDINKSGYEYKVIDNKIYMGLNGIKFAGEKTLNAIFKERVNGDFKNVDDFKARTKTNSRIIEYLTYANVFKCFGLVNNDLNKEREALGYNLKECVLDRFWWSKFCEQLGEVINIHKITTKRGDPMAFVTIYTASGNIRSVTVFPDMWSQCYKSIAVGVVKIFKFNSDGILKALYNPDELVKYVSVYVEDSEGFMRFYNSLIGDANIFDAESNYGISKISLDDDVLRFINNEFRIKKMEV